MDAFGFGIEESWCAVQNVLEGTVHADCTAGVEKLRRGWEKAKRKLYSESGATGRLVVDVEQQGILSYQHELGCRVARKHVAQTTLMFPQQERLAAYDILCCILSKIPDNALAQNKVRTISMFDGIPHPAPLSDLPERLVTTMRLGKFARQFAKWMLRRFPKNCNELADIIVAALSRATETLCVPKKTRVVLSVNPLDMLLVSNSTTGWSSCHRLAGSSCTGPLSYMLDSVTAVAYAYADCNVYGWQGYAYKLPSKFWRQMVHFDFSSPGALMSREYPSQHVASTKAARELAARLLGIEDDYQVHGNRIAKCCIDSESNWAYTDSPTACIQVGTRTPHLLVGVEAIPCVECGELRYSGPTNRLECAHCGRYGAVTCANCGERLTGSPYTNPRNGLSYCSECWNSLTATTATARY